MLIGGGAIRHKLAFLLATSVLLTVAAATAPSGGQILLRTLDTPNPQAWAGFGWPLAAGDVNGDGKGDIAVGDEVYLTNGIPAVILEITDETVTLDANHRLAGEALTFEIEVLAITRG